MGARLMNARKKKKRLAHKGTRQANLASLARAAEERTGGQSPPARKPAAR